MPKPLFQAEGQEPEGCRGARDRGQVDFRLPTFKIAGSDPEGAQSAFQGLPVKLLPLQGAAPEVDTWQTFESW